MQTVVIVSATRYNKTDFYSKSGLGRSISQSYSQFPIRSKIYFSNTRSLSVCYNDAISTSSVDDILIFVHDDVLLIDFFWLSRNLKSIFGHQYNGDTFGHLNSTTGTPWAGGLLANALMS